MKIQMYINKFLPNLNDLPTSLRYTQKPFSFLIFSFHTYIYTHWISLLLVRLLTWQNVYKERGKKIMTFELYTGMTIKGVWYSRRKRKAREISSTHKYTNVFQLDCQVLRKATKEIKLIFFFSTIFSLIIHSFIYFILYIFQHPINI